MGQSPFYGHSVHNFSLPGIHILRETSINMYIGLDNSHRHLGSTMEPPTSCQGVRLTTEHAEMAHVGVSVGKYSSPPTEFVVRRAGLILVHCVMQMIFF